MGSGLDVRRLSASGLRGSARVVVYVTRRTSDYARPAQGGWLRRFAGALVAVPAIVVAVPILLVVLAAAFLLAIVAVTALMFSLAVAVALVLVRRIGRAP